LGGVPEKSIFPSDDVRCSSPGEFRPLEPPLSDLDELTRLTAFPE
jgi:hypothetical protein